MTNEAVTAAARQRRGAVQLIAAMGLSGTLGVFVLESGASSFNVVFFRCLFGALALAAYCLFRGYLKNTRLTRGTLALAALGGVFIVFNWVLLFDAYSRTSISVATVVYHTQPFYVVLLGALLFKERLDRYRAGWIAAAFAGVVLVADLPGADLDGSEGYLLGVGEALVAALFYAFATVIAKRLTTLRPEVTALVQVLVGIPLLLPFTRLGDTAGLDARWGWLVGLGVIHTCVMYILLYSSYQKLATDRIAVLSFVYPAVAILVDLTVYGHRIDALQALGVVLIAAAALAVNLGRLPLPPGGRRRTAGEPGHTAPPKAEAVRR
ncbi:DMT family transporter [Streptomyces pristinaespiralis]|uniref:DMT family transporter n=1 Tax=Streptomyces pristinaespiralis TaxID=38300 RepID=UPI0033CAC338